MFLHSVLQQGPGLTSEGAPVYCTLNFKASRHRLGYSKKQDKDFNRVAATSASPIMALLHHLFASFFFCQGNLQGCEVVRMQQQFQTVKDTKLEAHRQQS